MLIAVIALSALLLVRRLNQPLFLLARVVELASSSSRAVVLEPALGVDGTTVAQADGTLNLRQTADLASPTESRRLDPAPLTSDGTGAVAMSEDGADVAASYYPDVISFGTSDGDLGARSLHSSRAYV